MVVVVIFFLNKSWIINDVNSLKKGQEISLHTLLEEKKKKKTRSTPFNSRFTLHTEKFL